MTHTVFCATWNNPFTGATGATSCGTIDELLYRVGPLFEDPTMVVYTSVLDANGIEILIDVMHLLTDDHLVGTVKVDTTRPGSEQFHLL